MIKVNGKKVAGIGQPGLNGKSAYETAKEGGFTGTEQEFNEILANTALKPKAILIAILESEWSDDTCTVMVPGVLADESKQLIYVMPTIESQEVYFNAGILCINQGLDELTFKALITPTDSIRLYIILQEVVENDF